MSEQLENQMIAEFDVPVEMRDGIVLRANIYRPNQEGKWPVLLHRHPYNKDTPPFLLDCMIFPVQFGRDMWSSFRIQGGDSLLRENGS